MEAFWLIGLTLVTLVSLVLAVFQLPGTWIILGGSILYAWHGHWQTITPTVLGILAGLAILGELWEFASSALLARRAGASARASWFALAGGFLGMFIFSIPVPVLGTIFGAVAGCFAGAVIGEMTVREDMAGAARVGASAAVGRVLGTIGKLMVTLVMAALGLGTAIVSAFS
jgi:uncharacterized protein YqgC (DUF456 family)